MTPVEKVDAEQACEPGLRAVFADNPGRLWAELLRLRAVMTLTRGVAEEFDRRGIPWRACDMDLIR